MGMQSPELLTLVDNCPKGAETLITRIIHILTEKGTSLNIAENYLADIYRSVLLWL